MPNIKLAPQDTVLFVHIEHQKPLEITNFVKSVKAINSLYSSYVKKNGGENELSSSKLCIEKVERGSIDLFLGEMVASSMIPFIENVNIVMQFAEYLKKILEYFTKGIGNKPELSAQEYGDIHDVFSAVTGDHNSSMTIGAIQRDNITNIFNNCSFYFNEANSAQNQIRGVIEEKRNAEPTDRTYNRVLMQIYQLRKDLETNKDNKGNRAIIDDIFKGKNFPVVFDTDKLKNDILYTVDNNPTQKIFQVDVIVQTVNDKICVYKVIALHDIIDISETE